MAGVFYVVATPLGNLGDVTPRAVDILGSVSQIYAEDTRHSQKLLRHLGIGTPMTSLHNHNELDRIDRVLERLQGGESLALISDAGTPSLSDPGARVVCACHAAGIAVSPIPGPSALSTALSVAGFAQASHEVLFVGFLPAKGKERRRMLEQIASFAGVVVLFEGPHRAAATLAELAEPDGQREVVVCRELTKMHEEVYRDSAAAVAAWAKEGLRGEMTIVLGPIALAEDGEAERDEAALKEKLKACLAAGLSAKDCAQAAQIFTGVRRKEAYRWVQELKSQEE